MENFADRLIEAIKRKRSCVCVGLDPRMKQIPKFIKDQALKENAKNKWKAAAEAIIEFNKGIIDAVEDLVPIVKPQIAFYEQYGSEGFRAFEETCAYARGKGLLVLVDGKRNDIGSTAEAYANAFLGDVDLFGEEVPGVDADALTVTPYLGWDGVKPFADKSSGGKGMFVLVKTSNKTSADLQDLKMADERTIYEIMGHFVESWGADHVGESGYSSIGAVVGATYPEEAKRLREIMSQSIFLVPGYGAQGGGAEDVKPCFNSDGLGAIINSSRGITFAYQQSDKFGDNDYAEAARAAVEEMNADLGFSY